MSEHVCPVWIGYLLLSPLRKLSQKPEKVVGPYIKPGMTVLEPGCAMGYFTLPMAQMVGSEGRVIAVDVQEKMLAKLKKRSGKAGLSDRIERRLINGSGMHLDDLGESVDFVPVINVVHEVGDQKAFFSELYQALKPGGRMLVMEPKGHVKKDEFAAELQLAEDVGFQRTEPANPLSGMAALLLRP